MCCTAKAKHRQAPCRLPAVPGMDKCRFHGGKTPRGSAAPAFRTGRYSKFLPARLQERYQQALHDPELLSLYGEIALTDARLADLLQRLDSGESGARWQQLTQAHTAFKHARQTGHVEQMREALAALETLLDAAIQD